MDRQTLNSCRHPNRLLIVTTLVTVRVHCLLMQHLTFLNTDCNVYWCLLVVTKPACAWPVCSWLPACGPWAGGSGPSKLCFVPPSELPICSACNSLSLAGVVKGGIRPDPLNACLWGCRDNLGSLRLKGFVLYQDGGRLLLLV